VFAYVGLPQNLKDLKIKGWYTFTHPNRATLYLFYTSLCTGELNAIRKHKRFLCSPFYGRACRWAMLGELKPKGPKGLERKHGLSTEQFPVSAYVGSSKT